MFETKTRYRRQRSLHWKGQTQNQQIFNRTNIFSNGQITPVAVHKNATAECWYQR